MTEKYFHVRFGQVLCRSKWCSLFANSIEAAGCEAVMAALDVNFTITSLAIARSGSAPGRPVARTFSNNSRFFRSLGKFFEVYALDQFGPIRTCSDAFGCIRMRSGAFEKF